MHVIAYLLEIRAAYVYVYRGKATNKDTCAVQGRITIKSSERAIECTSQSDVWRCVTTTDNNHTPTTNNNNNSKRIIIIKGSFVLFLRFDMKPTTNRQ